MLWLNRVRPAREATTPPAARPQVEPEDEGRRAAQSRPRRSRGGVAVAAAAAAGTFLALVARNSYLFTTPIHEDSDFAANSILVDQAQQLRLLVGNYSRVHFHHPGPALLYVEAGGKALFHDLLHLVPTPYNGELLAVFVLNALLVGLTVRIVFRHGASAAVAAVALAIILAWTAGHVPLSSVWFPHMYFAPFLLLAVAGASVAGGTTEDMPAFILAGGLLVHGHVAFTMFVGVSAVVGLCAWWWSVRGRWRLELGKHWHAVAGAGLLLTLFLLPIVLELVLHWPGQWSLYLDYLRSRSGSPNPIPAALRYAAGFWSPSSGWGAALALAGAACIGLAATDPERPRGAFVLRLLGAVGLLTLLFVLYAVRGVDNLRQTYIGIFYGAVPLTLLLATGLAAGRLLDRAGRVAAGAVLGLACAVAVAAGVAGHTFANGYRGDPELPGMVATLRDAPARAGRPVTVVRFSHDAWPEVAGFVLAAHREGLRACVDDAVWTFMLTPAYVCGSQERLAGWRLDIRLLRPPRAPPSGVVWTGSTVFVAPHPPDGR